MSNEKEIDFRPHPTQDERWSRPPLNEVPMWATQAAWNWAVPGGWEERVAAIIRIECSACSLWYRAYKDDPRPCPGCSLTPEGPLMREFSRLEEMRRERDDALNAARQLGDKADSMRKSLDVARTERDEATRELDAARKVVNVVRDRKATLGNGALSGVEKVRALMAALDEYVAACGGPAAAEKIMEQVEKERMR